MAKALKILLLCSVLNLLSTSSAHSKTLNSFSDLRHDILNVIGKATKRIHLATYYLTDGEIVTALYLAKYRKVDVKVFLGFQKANHYMSRLAYLKRQKIPAFLAPRTFPLKRNTIILIDDEVYTSDSDLDFKTLKRSFRFNRVPDTSKNKFIMAFQGSLKSPTPAKLRPRLRVGRANPNPNRRIYRPAPTDGTYDYDRHNQPRTAPAGIPTRLPAKTKHQLKQMKQVDEAMKK